MADPVARSARCCAMRSRCSAWSCPIVSDPEEAAEIAAELDG